MGLRCRTSSVRRGLEDDINVLRMAEAMREKYVSGAVGKTRHVISFRAKLFGYGRVGDDDAGNSGSIICPNEHGRRPSRTSTIVDGHAKKADADRMMCMMSSVKEADIGAGEGAVGKQEVAIVGSAGHRTVIGVCKREVAAAIVGLCEAAKQYGVRRGVEVHRFRCRECRVRIGDRDGDGMDSRRLKTILEVGFGESCCANRFLLISGRGVVIVFVISVCGGGENIGSSVGMRGLLHDAAHRASGRSAGEGRATTSPSRIEAATELFVEVGDLRFELGITLGESLGDNVIHKTIAVLELVSRVVATQTNRGGILMLGDGTNHEVELCLIEGGLGVGREIRRRGLNTTDNILNSSYMFIRCLFLGSGISCCWPQRRADVVVAEG
jgi:hypothetical protein